MKLINWPILLLTILFYATSAQAQENEDFGLPKRKFLPHRNRKRKANRKLLLRRKMILKRK